jgi:hypothetical protein
VSRVRGVVGRAGGHTRVVQVMNRVYILSLGLPITRGSPGPTVPSGLAAPGSGGYKNTLRLSGIKF